MKLYVLDTSAVMAYFFNEAGAEKVDRLLRMAEKKRGLVSISFMTAMEVLYRIWQRVGEREGKAWYLRLKALPVQHIQSSEGLLLQAARLKAHYAMSVADAWIAATAQVQRAVLVHKDPEFEPLFPDLSLMPLYAVQRPGVGKKRP